MSERRKRTGIMLAYPMEERRLTNPKFGWTWPVIVQPKLDGERARAPFEYHEREYFLRSSTNLPVESVPHIVQALSMCNLPEELDGELYVHGWDFEDIHSVVSRGADNLHESSDLMEYHIYDYVSEDPQVKRSAILADLNEDLPSCIKIVPSYIAHSLAEIHALYVQILNEGYEGIIVRHPAKPYVRKRSTFMLKFKPKKTDYYKIVGIIEARTAEGDAKGMVGAFSCRGNDETVFRVGAGELSHGDREYIWMHRDAFIGMWCEVSYQNLTAGQVPRFGLCKRILNHNPEEERFEGGIL